MAKMIFNDFYCLNCGTKQYTLPRARGHMHEKFHRKRLYCLKCKTEVNMIEIRDEWDAYDFIQDFNDGLYKEEAEESINFTTKGAVNHT